MASVTVAGDLDSQVWLATWVFIPNYSKLNSVKSRTLYHPGPGVLLDTEIKQGMIASNRGPSTNWMLMLSRGLLPSSIHSSCSCSGVTSSMQQPWLPSLRRRQQRAFRQLQAQGELSYFGISSTAFFDKTTVKGQNHVTSVLNPPHRSYMVSKRLPTDLFLTSVFKLIE